MTAEAILHIAFIVGLLSQISKITDFLVLEGQKKTIQNKFELLALKINSINPLLWYDRFVNFKTLKMAYLVIFFFLFVIFCAFISPMLIISFLTDEQVELVLSKFGLRGHVDVHRDVFFYVGIFSIVTFAIALFMQIYKMMTSVILSDEVPTSFTDDYTESRLHNMSADGRFDIFIVRFIRHTIPITTLIFLSFIIGCQIYTIIVSITLLVFSVSCLIERFRIPLILWIVILLLGFVVIAYSGILLIFKFIIGVLDAIFWRIGSYNKGATQAITILITCLLGIIELYLKLYRQ